MTTAPYLVVMVGLTVFLPSVQAQSVEAERVRIENTRQQLQASFAIEDTACHQKFAVNSCLNDINIKHRESIADLRRQEISLNDDERRKRGAEQVRRVEEKLLATNRQASSDRRALMFSEYTNQASREEASKKRKVERASDENRFTVSPLEMKAREKRLLSDGRSSFGGEKAEQYQDRQNQALERRQKHEAVLSKRPPFTAKPLPVPP